MSKRKALKRRHKIIERKAGAKPGSLYVPSSALQPRFFLVSFSETFYDEKELENYGQLLKSVKERPDAKHWIDIRGYGDLSLLEHLTKDFGLHPLQVEDVINDYQRPKVEEFSDDRLFIITRMLNWSDTLQTIDDDQLSLFTGPNYILTLQSDYEDCLDPLRERIRQGKGLIRHRPVIYTAYAMLDVVYDFYFPVMGDISNYIDELEHKVLVAPSRRILAQILNLKGELIKLRRIIWPERDNLNELLRMDENLVPENMKVYFRDAYDHVVQLIDLVDSHKDMTSSLVELYMSTVGNRMNEIMKVLTIISTIFIPLSFIVGLYGMNFAHENPETGKVFPMSMPELYQPYGYPILLGLMLVLVLFQLYFFYRKGWFRSL
ncbi:magnesium/cobalt transporter CorA [Pontibacter fetidus]|uniref:Magnesium transport protein CorA n=1 Tax=Pontibacter fetidus TaxID=2700082 RepID=A0A6B2H4N8_9BACT|nr:magnesium/cobalt transporter CorA [Pontibacter fetidus]NDK57088.1 magnesium/cobalt transporter CorA [Pontibacter fetidus]